MGKIYPKGSPEYAEAQARKAEVRALEEEFSDKVIKPYARSMTDNPLGWKEDDGVREREYLTVTSFYTVKDQQRFHALRTVVSTDPEKALEIAMSRCLGIKKIGALSIADMRKIAEVINHKAVSVKHDVTRNRDHLNGGREVWAYRADAEETCKARAVPVEVISCGDYAPVTVSQGNGIAPDRTVFRTARIDKLKATYQAIMNHLTYEECLDYGAMKLAERVQKQIAELMA